MGELRDILTGGYAERDAHAGSLPALPTLEPPSIGTPLGAPAQAGTDLARFGRTLRTVGRVGLMPLTMTVEGLTRFEDVFQASVLTAFGRIPRSEYGPWVDDIMHGRRRIDGATFAQLAGWSAARETLDRMSVVPGWVKRVAAPEGYMMERPRVSFGNVFDFAIETLISPFAAVSMMPRALVVATKLDKVTELATLPLTAPLRLAARALFEPTTPVGAFFFRLREPLHALARFPAIPRQLVLDSKYLEDAATFWRPKLTELYRRHRVGVGFIDWLRGYRPNPEIRPELVWRHLGQAPQALNGAERALVHDITEEVLVPLRDKLAENGDHILHLRRRVQTARSGPFRPQPTSFTPGAGRVTQLGEAGVRERVHMGGVREWNPRRDGLRPFHLVPKNFVQEARRIGDRSFEQRTNVMLPWKALEQDPYDVRHLKPEQMDPFHSLDFFISQAERRYVLYRKGGTLARFRPRTEFGGPKQTPALRGMNDAEFNYWLEKVHQITGNQLRKPDIILQRVGDRFWQGLTDMVSSVDRQGRIRRLFPWLDNPRLGRPTNVTAILVARQMQSLLGFSLSGAIKNSSQLLNEAAVEGVPAVWRGLYRMVHWTSSEARVMKDARRMASFGNEYAKLAHDNVWSRAGGTWERMLMGAFNTSENIVRGIAHNVHTGEALEARGVRTLAQWEALPAAEMRRVVDEGFLHAVRTNFVYGSAGRSALMMHPVARMGFALQSYTFKELEFAAQLFRTDGLAFTRLLALHGWAIESLYHGAGINAENWLGWGFLPPQSRVFEGPALSTAKNLGGMLYALAADDDKAFADYVDRTRGSLREVFRLFGDPDDAAGLQAGLAAAATFGLAPIPIVAVGRTARAVNELLTGRREAQGGRVWRPVTREEAVTSYFFTTHAEAEAQRLRTMEASTRRAFDGEMRSRTRRFVSALEGTSGDDVTARAAELFEEVPIRIPLTAQLAPGRFVGDERFVRPTPQMVEDRVRHELMRRKVPQGVRELVESGWTGQVLWAEYAAAALRDLEAGGRVR